MQINPKKYSCNGLEQNSQKENVNENKFMRLEPSSPITFLMVRPLYGA